MASKTSICNQAISRCGGNLILTVDDGSDEANLCKANFDAMREIVLEEHDWTFAIRRYKLSPSVVDAPANQYANSFLVPAEVIHIIRAGADPDDRKRNTTNWRKEEGYIIADASILYVKAVVNVTDVATFSPMFRQAVALRLAAEIAVPLTADKGLQRSLMSEYGIVLDGAASRDGQIGTSEQIRASDYKEAR